MPDAWQRWSAPAAAAAAAAGCVLVGFACGHRIALLRCDKADAREEAELQAVARALAAINELHSARQDRVAPSPSVFSTAVQRWVALLSGTSVALLTPALRLAAAMQICWSRVFLAEQERLRVAALLSRSGLGPTLSRQALSLQGPRRRLAAAPSDACPMLFAWQRLSSAGSSSPRRMGSTWCCF